MSQAVPSDTHVNAPDRRGWLRAVLLAALVYVVVGLSTAYLAGPASSLRLRTLWRLAAWVLSLVCFGSQVVYERFRLRISAFRTALHASGAVAVGAFGLAAAGPVRSHWGGAEQWRVALLSLVLWPVVTAVPAFLVALAAGAVIGRHAPRADPTRS